MQDLVALSYKFDSPLSPIYGMDRNPSKLPIACAACIGACCIGPILAHTENPAAGKEFVLNHGCIHSALIPESYPHDQKLLGKSRMKEILYDRRIRETWIRIAHESMDAAATSTRNNSFSMCGPCGSLLSDGSCADYFGSRPALCKDVKPNDPFCLDRFVALGSDAAKTIQNIINNALPILNNIRETLNIPKSHQFPFDFS